MIWAECPPNDGALVLHGANGCGFIFTACQFDYDVYVGRDSTLTLDGRTFNTSANIILDGGLTLVYTLGTHDVPITLHVAGYFNVTYQGTVTVSFTQIFAGIAINMGGCMDGDYAGYFGGGPGGHPAGAPGGFCVATPGDSTVGPNGGSHMTCGANGDNNLIDTAVYDNPLVYPNVRPGAGGGASPTGGGGSGGGALVLWAPNIFIEGTISLDGQSTEITDLRSAGGGAGGALYVRARSLLFGSGASQININTRGGDTADPGGIHPRGGGGGAGGVTLLAENLVQTTAFGYGTLRNTCGMGANYFSSCDGAFNMTYAPYEDVYGFGTGDGSTSSSTSGGGSTQTTTGGGGGGTNMASTASTQSSGGSAASLSGGGNNTTTSTTTTSSSSASTTDSSSTTTGATASSTATMTTQSTSATSSAGTNSASATASASAGTGQDPAAINAGTSGSGSSGAAVGAAIGVLVVLLLALLVVGFIVYRRRGSRDSTSRPVSGDESTLKHSLKETTRATQVRALLAAKSSTLLGAGLTAQVFKVKDKAAGKGASEWVAVKVFKLDTAAAADEFHAEVAIFGRLGDARHPNVVGLHYICSEANLHAIVMDLVDGGSVQQYVIGDKASTPELRTRIALDVARGMDFLHAHGVIHLDIKPGNLLMTAGSEGCVKVVDFGASTVCENGDEITQGPFVGTLQYCAPERLIVDGKIHLKPTDVYSYGVTLWALLARRLPFAGESTDAILASKRSGGDNARSLLTPTWTGEEGLTALMAICMSHEPVKRPSFPDVCNTLAQL